MAFKNKENHVFQMFELSPTVDQRDSLKILIKTGLAEQSGFKRACKQGEHRFYGWWDPNEKVLKIKAVDVKEINRFIQVSKR